MPRNPTTPPEAGALHIATLPLHLSLAMASWLSSNAALPLARQGLPFSNPAAEVEAPPASRQRRKPSKNASARGAAAKKSPPPNAANPSQFPENLARLLEHPQLQQAIQHEATERTVRLLRGIDHFYKSGYARKEHHAPQTVWQRGNAKLLAYPSLPEAAPLLLIPSLINRYYILDLYEGNSLIDHLTAAGYACYVMDWGAPGERERSFDCGDYVGQYLVSALNDIHLQHRQPVSVLGYCMGGLFALALAQLRPAKVQSLALLATPWDFAAEDVPHFQLDDELLDWYRALVEAEDTLPPAFLQTIFHLADPWNFQQKFARFPELKGAEKAHFLAVESWVNDGVPLTRRVAHECLIDWPYRNALAGRQWRVSGQAINPTTITVPSLVIVPQGDRIVSEGCALPLAELLPDAALLRPHAGHVSMVVGRRAKQEVWKPLVEWLDRERLG